MRRRKIDSGGGQNEAVCEGEKSILRALKKWGDRSEDRVGITEQRKSRFVSAAAHQNGPKRTKTDQNGPKRIKLRKRCGERKTQRYILRTRSHSRRLLMRLFCGARLPLARAIALRGSARNSSSSLRTPPRRSFRRHCAPLIASGALRKKWEWQNG